MQRLYRPRSTLRPACAVLAVLATASIAVFINGLVHDGAARQAYSPQPVVVAKVLRNDWGR
ncbi:MAG TPA: hypothetical protein VLW55_09345 [Burkholderiaceae bacterium]|nr:hypothetical protein [Burkholderiaceae bacterium]